MQAERDSGNYTLLKFTEPSGRRRMVASYVVENVVAPDIHLALTDTAAAARWCTAGADPDGRAVLEPAGVPAPLTLIRSRPTDLAEFAVRHGEAGESLATVTLSPAARCTVVAVTHREIPAGDAPAWARFWAGTVFLQLGDVLQRGLASARPTIVKI